MKKLLAILGFALALTATPANAGGGTSSGCYTDYSGNLVCYNSVQHGPIFKGSTETFDPLGNLIAWTKWFFNMATGKWHQSGGPK